MLRPRMEPGPRIGRSLESLDPALADAANAQGQAVLLQPEGRRIEIRAGDVGGTSATSLQGQERGMPQQQRHRRRVERELELDLGRNVVYSAPRGPRSANARFRPRPPVSRDVRARLPRVW